MTCAAVFTGFLKKFMAKYMANQVKKQNYYAFQKLKSFLARLLILIKKGGLLQLKFGVVGVGVGVNIYLWAR